MEERDRTELMIQLTYRCNLDCRHCAYGDIKNQECPMALVGLTEGAFLSMHKPQLIKLSGGEPTLSKDFEYMVRLCKGSGAKTIAFTNGTGNPKKDPDAYWVSLFGERKIHNNITRQDTFDKVIAFIKTHEVEYLNSPVFSREQLKSLKELGRKLDIPLRVTRLIPHGNAVDVLRLERQQHIVRSLELHRSPHWATCSLGFEPARCWKKMCLKPDGTTVICTALIRGLECPFRKKIPTLVWNKLFQD